jgi:hypothetical protein
MSEGPDDDATSLSLARLLTHKEAFLDDILLGLDYLVLIEIATVYCLE